MSGAKLRAPPKVALLHPFTVASPVQSAVLALILAARIFRAYQIKNIGGRRILGEKLLGPAEALKNSKNFRSPPIREWTRRERGPVAVWGGDANKLEG